MNPNSGGGEGYNVHMFQDIKPKQNNTDTKNCIFILKGLLKEKERKKKSMLSKSGVLLEHKQ